MNKAHLQPLVVPIKTGTRPKSLERFLFRSKSCLSRVFFLFLVSYLVYTFYSNTEKIYWSFDNSQRLVHLSSFFFTLLFRRALELLGRFFVSIHRCLHILILLHGDWNTKQEFSSCFSLYSCKQRIVHSLSAEAGEIEGSYGDVEVNWWYFSSRLKWLWTPECLRSDECPHDLRHNPRISILSH